MRPTICTSRGIEFPPLAPRADLVDYRDIAHALAHQPRFAGHARRFYSVAQHSVAVSFICDSADMAKGLLHDAAEAYLVDVPTPVKRLFPGYHAAEARLLRVIYEAFGLDAAELIPGSVAKADEHALRSERTHLMPDAAWWPPHQVPNIPWGGQVPLDPDHAKLLFIDRLEIMLQAGLIKRLPMVQLPQPAWSELELQLAGTTA